MTDVIENFWRSYYGDNCPYYKKVFPRKKVPLQGNQKKEGDKNNIIGNEMKYYINGRPKSRQKSDVKNGKKNKSDCEKEKEKKEKDEERKKYENQDKYDTRVPYYSTTRTALAPLNSSPWREDRPPIIG